MTQRSPSGGRKITRRSAKPANVFPTFDEIAWRAHEIFTSQAGRSLSIFECWRLAEDELLDQAASRALR